MTEQEYRQDDTNDAYCPQCGEPLSGLTVAGSGYCDEHEWVWADWSGTLFQRYSAADDEGDDSA